MARRDSGTAPATGGASRWPGWWPSGAAHWTRTGSIAGVVGVLVAIVAIVVPMAAKPSGGNAGPAGGAKPSTTTLPQAPFTLENRPDFSVLFQADDYSGWRGQLSITPAVTVQYLVEYRNVGNVRQDNVTVTVDLPPEVTYLKNSTRFAYARIPNGVITDDVARAGGINLGSYAPGGGFWLTFATVMAGEDQFPCGQRTLAPLATVTTANGAKSAEVVLHVQKLGCPTSGAGG